MLAKAPTASTRKTGAELAHCSPSTRENSGGATAAGTATTSAVA